MTRAADWHKLTFDKKTEQLRRISVNPPLDVAKDILSRPASELRFPSLELVSESPFIRPDGVIVCTPGYDACTQTYYSPVGNLDGFQVPEMPTAEDVASARALIEEALSDFPFVDQSSRANAIAELITPEVRTAIKGNIPIGLIDAPQAGSGKTLLAGAAAEINTGGAAAMRPAPIRDDDEWRKTLTATIQMGQCLTIFDNLETVLDSPSLALAVTASIWTDRILGRTQLVTLPQRSMFIVTGNNIALGGDLARRCVWIRLDAKCSEPWRNREYRHPGLLDWLRCNRGRLLAAILTLARAWFTAGCPKPSTVILGSFEQWCTTVGGILKFAGIEGFLGNLDELYEQADPSSAAWEGFLMALFRLMPQKVGFRVADITERLKQPGDELHPNELRPTVPEDLGEVGDKGFQHRLGKALRKRIGRRYGERGVHLLRMGSKQNVAMWEVRVDREAVS